MNKNIKDLTGMRFKMLEVISYYDIYNGHARWLCKCDCGNDHIATGTEMIKGRIKSCGCLRSIENKSRATHNMTNSKMYNTYRSMIKRCYLKSNASYHRYGGRGITVCDEWRDSFEAFRDWALENGYQDNLQIDRIDNGGNYEPLNCRWSTVKEQANNRSTSVVVEINGVSRSLYEWQELSGIRYQTISDRITKGWDKSRWLEPPRRQKNNAVLKVQKGSS